MINSVKAQDELSQSPFNPEFLEYLRVRQAEEDSLIFYGKPYSGVIPSPIIPITKPLPGINSKSFPARYDLRDQGWVTSVKEQENCNASYVFSNMSAIESNWLREGYGSYDLSEDNIIHCHDFDISACEGGNPFITAAMLTQGHGPFSETQDPFVGSDENTCPSGLTPLSYISDIWWGNTEISSIKQAIQDFGAISALIYFYPDFYNSGDYTYCYDGSESDGAYRYLTIAGWDDEKVTEADDPGAWIIKDSRGEAWGEAGYFYMSYYDYSGIKNTVFFPKRLDYDSTRIISGYDELGWVTDVGYAGYINDEIAYVIVKFVPDVDVIIQGVGTYAVVSGTSIDISIYDDFDGDSLMNLLGSMNTPTCQYAGYYTFKLTDSLKIRGGDPYYVHIKYNTGSDYGYPIPMEYSIYGYSSQVEISDSGFNWISRNNEDWYSLEKRTSSWEPCVKTFALPCTDSLAANFKASPTSGPPPLHVQFEDLSVGDIVSWEWDFDGDGETDSNEPNPSYEYTEEGVHSVTLTVYDDQANDSNTRHDYIHIKSSSVFQVSSGVNNIQDVIDQARDGDTIVVHPGVYYENINFKGKDIVLTSLYLQTKDTSYISKTIIDGSQKGRVVTFDQGESNLAELWGFTITNGLGGIYCESSSPKIVKNIISNNNSDNGGGIRCYGSSPVIKGNRIENNFAYIKGGGLYLSRNNRSSRLENNLMFYNKAALGGGIYLYKDNSAIVNNMLADNKVVHGGGNLLIDSYNDIDNSIFKSSTQLSPFYDDSYVLSNNIPVNGWILTVKYDYYRGVLVGVTIPHPIINIGSSGKMDFYIQNCDTITIDVEKGGRYFLEVPIRGTYDSWYNYQYKVFIKSSYNLYSYDISIPFEDICFKTPTVKDFGPYPNSEILVVKGDSTLRNLNYNAIYNSQWPNAMYVEDSLFYEVNLEGRDGNSYDDPLIDFPDYSLGESSPGIDAGNPLSFYNDRCLPPGLGTSRNDMGAYGGNANCIWDDSCFFKAAFSAAPTKGYAPLTVEFTDQSIGEIISWSWDFNGDGTEDSDEPNPEYTYPKEGIYSARLIVSNGELLDTLEKQDFITVKEPVVADFTGFPARGYVPLTVSFSDQSAGSVTSWSWDLNGDGQEDSDDSNPEFEYTGMGSYSVGLIVSDGEMRDTLTKTDYVVVYEELMADFTGTPNEGYAPLMVSFNDQSQGSINGWDWDFDGDGSSDSQEANPEHEYADTGSYAVRLIVADELMRDTLIREDYILVRESVSADFEADATSGTIPLTVNFQDLSKGDIVSWNWDLDGDGTWDDTHQNCSHTYDAAGTYSVTLEVTDGVQTHSKSRVDYITVEEATSLEDILAGEQLVVYPNPTTDRVIIQVGNDHRVDRLVLARLDGQVMATWANPNIRSNRMYLDLSSYAKGVYLLKIHLENEVAAVRLVVE
jgi:PKD repeat protein/C1A family cysteine protease